MSTSEPFHTQKRLGELSQSLRGLVGASLATAATVGILNLGSSAQAQVYAGSENYSIVPIYDQLTETTVNNLDFIGPNACVPTSTAEGLAYLQYYQTQVLGKPSPFTTSVLNNTDTAEVPVINGLATAMNTQQNNPPPNPGGPYGTTYPDRINGTTSYLSRTGANPSTAYVVGGQYAPSYDPAASIGPTVQSTMQANSTAGFLASSLNNHWGVQFSLLWGDLSENGTYTKGQGGHQVDLEAISYNSRTGTGTISFIDPYGGDDIVDATLTKVRGGLYAGDLYVTYPALTPDPGIGADNGELGEDNFAGLWLDGAAADPGDGGIIINDMAEAVPDGSVTSVLMGVSFLGLAAIKRRLS
jgi:hypothetical protein